MNDTDKFAMVENLYNNLIKISKCHHCTCGYEDKEGNICNALKFVIQYMVNEKETDEYEEGKHSHTFNILYKMIVLAIISYEGIDRQYILQTLDDLNKKHI